MTNQITPQQPVAARYFNQFNGWVVTHIDHAMQMHKANGYAMQLLYADAPPAAFEDLRYASDRALIDLVQRLKGYAQQHPAMFCDLHTAAAIVDYVYRSRDDNK